MVNEIRRLVSASGEYVWLHHYRDKRREVDLVLERPNGDVVAVEIKASSSPVWDDIKHLIWLRDELDVVSPGSFRAGVLLHTGSFDRTVTDRIAMRPASSLWASHNSPFNPKQV